MECFLISIFQSLNRSMFQQVVKTPSMLPAAIKCARFYKGNWGHKSSLFVYQKAVFLGGVVQCLLGASSLMRRYYCNINNEAIKNTLCVLGLFFLSYTSLAPFASWPWPNWMPVWRLWRRRSSQNHLVAWLRGVAKPERPIKANWRGINFQFSPNINKELINFQ